MLLLRDPETRGTFINLDSEKQNLRIPESLNSSFSLDGNSIIEKNGNYLDLDQSEYTRGSIIKNLENFKLDQVKEKLEGFLLKINQAGNISPNESLCLFPFENILDDDDDEDNRGRNSNLLFN